MLKLLRSNISIQVCDNGYVVEYGATLVDDTYKSFKVVCDNLDQLTQLLGSLTETPLEHY